MTASSSKYPTNAWQDLGEIRYAYMKIQGQVHEACGGFDCTTAVYGVQGKGTPGMASVF